MNCVDIVNVCIAIVYDIGRNGGYKIPWRDEDEKA